MDIEFHYYMTYLIAARAGLSPSDSLRIAHAAQYTDDNDMVFEIQKNQAEYFKNYISQTMNILNPKPKLFRIYPVFHFVPGDPLAPAAYRRDGRMHWLNTTPGGVNATRLLDEALTTGNHYRIGLACHAYADTWAHQNFIGYYDEFNSMTGLLESATPNIGHADARHDPDWPALIWKDRRLLVEDGRVDNTQRFLAAARHLFRMLRKYADKTVSDAAIKLDEDGLAKHLSEAIGDRDPTNERKSTRVARYKALAQTAAYGSAPLPEYDDCVWFEAAVKEEVRGLRDRSDTRWARWDPLTDVYTWRDTQTYQATEWYQFQLAVKEHQVFAIALLNESLRSKMELEGF